MRSAFLRAIDIDGPPKLSRKGAKGVSTFRAGRGGMRGVNYRPIGRRGTTIHHHHEKDGHTSADDELSGRGGTVSDGEGFGTASVPERYATLSVQRCNGPARTTFNVELLIAGE